MITPIDRFWAKVHKGSDCWNWIGATNGRYGDLWLGRKLVRAHRFAYELLIGPIPSGLWVLHRCDNGLCVKPEHLFVGTNADNQRDAVGKKRTIHWTHPERLARGERNGWSKLTDSQVEQIRSRYRLGIVGCYVLGREFGVTSQQR